MPTFLVATPQLRDPNFKKAVVLLLEHTPEGAMGFVVNRLAGVNLRSVLPPGEYGGAEDVPKDLPVWYGGPVETGTGVILHAASVSPVAAGLDDDESPLDTQGENILLSSNTEVLAEFLAYGRLVERGELEGHPASVYLHPYRFVVGYSGWGAGQLDKELRQGAWLQLPVSEELLFNSSSGSLWQRCIESIGIKPSAIAPSEHSFLH